MDGIRRVVEWSMKMLVCCATLACLTGCIPIGVRGTSITAADSPSCGAPQEIDMPLRPGADTGTTRADPRQAPPRCA
jgi:hypothetical protein